MPLTPQTRTGVVLLLAVIGLFILYQFWQWEVERVEVLSGNYLVRIHRLWGTALPEGEIVAPDEGYKGVMLDVLPEGRHFLNPIFWGYEVHKIIEVPAGKCLVLARKYGKPLSDEDIAQGNLLAKVPFPVPEGQRGQEERGIVEEVLRPGSYRINPYAYSWELVAAVEVGVDQVGVRTLKIGRDPRELPAEVRKRNPYVVPDDQPGALYRGIQATPISAGTYYLNPYRETVTPVEVRSHRVELSDIEFPSRDGFLLKPHVVVEYAVQPEKAPEMLVRMTDEGELFQRDATPEEQSKNQILQKVILPHIRGYARIEGSNFDARDFIVVNAPAASGAGPAVAQKAVNNREALQKALEAKVRPRCEELGINVRAVTVADLVPPEELAEQIREREVALVELAKNKVMLGQYKTAQELMAKEALKQQYKEKVEAETGLVQAKTRAEQLKEVEKSRLEQELQNAQIRLDASRQQAEATLTKGKAEAAVIGLQNEAEVAGLRKAIQAFGNVQSFAQYHVLARLGPAVSEIFASDDSDFARMLSTFLTPADAAATAAGALSPKPVAGAPATTGR